MSFDTPNGTYGTRQPKAGLLMGWFNGWNMNRIRRKGGRVMGMDALVLTTVGRKSGAERSTPVAYFPDGNDAWLVVASANGGRDGPHPERDRRRVEENRLRAVSVSALDLHARLGLLQEQDQDQSDHDGGDDPVSIAGGRCVTVAFGFCCLAWRCASHDPRRHQKRDHR